MSSTPTGTHTTGSPFDASRSPAIPALPGAHHICATCGDCAWPADASSTTAAAASPAGPEPTTATRQLPPNSPVSTVSCSTPPTISTGC